MRRWLALAAAALVMLAGASAIYAGLVARGRFEPDTVHWAGDELRVVRRFEDQALMHDLVRGTTVVYTLAGSLDTMCDAPWIMLVDVDGDGRLDVYHRHCGGHGYLRYQPATRTLEHVELGSIELRDAPVLDSSWAREVKDWRGVRLIGLGALLALADAIGLVVLALTAKPTRARPDRA
jgi:hypothetical protein